ncbi:TetR/AcrR family transcriptional regulator [Solwaraspora sp. WMMA2056]|uniref:TetR/AcrR family transcriptional regulator n=1 Tax=Solwaraspora sp. WMMA2056 TaxID=3015161 RepID=UPI00259BE078|nr:TetR/AcrR family transcriptional regulator [Solwaraspora sp. WMMA2056]WJK42187.1 TetR/AcrR family transcriptional regulator [Solwaraspora sp. WMMA2056]
MTERSGVRRARAERASLTRDRVIAAAVALADEKGAAGVTMRAVAARLGVEAMSLYHHVSGRDGILDGMVDAVFAEIGTPPTAVPWRAALRDRAVAVRAALWRHPWAVGLLDSRAAPGPATLRHHDAVLGCLRTGGFSVQMAVHAMSVLDSYLYGFVLQERSLPFADAADAGVVAGGILQGLPAGSHPYLAEVVAEQLRVAGYDHTAEFEFGLDLILDALGPDEQETGGRVGGAV